MPAKYMVNDLGEVHTCLTNTEKWRNWWWGQLRSEVKMCWNQQTKCLRMPAEQFTRRRIRDHGTGQTTYLCNMWVWNRYLSVNARIRGAASAASRPPITTYSPKTFCCLQPVNLPLGLPAKANISSFSILHSSLSHCIQLISTVWTNITLHPPSSWSFPTSWFKVSPLCSAKKIS